MTEDLSEESLERVLAADGERIALHPTLLDVGLSDITDAQAEKLVYAAINGLFAAHREDGRTAYIELMINRSTGRLWLETEYSGVDIQAHEDVVERYVFRSLVNGAWKPEGEPCVYPATVGEAVCNSVKAVLEAWPNHASQQIVWRHLPALERQDAHDDIVRAGEVIIPAEPARWKLYMRLVATPVV